MAGWCGAAMVRGGQTSNASQLPDIAKASTLPAMRVSAFAGVWAEVQPTYSSGYLVSDVANTRTSPWCSTNVRAGWDGEAGSMRLAPFISINNALNHQYVSSVVINAGEVVLTSPPPAATCISGFQSELGGSSQLLRR